MDTDRGGINRSPVDDTLWVIAAGRNKPPPLPASRADGMVEAARYRCGLPGCPVCGSFRGPPG